MKPLNFIDQVGRKCSSSVCIVLTENNCDWMKGILKNSNIKIIKVNDILTLKEMISALGEVNIAAIGIDLGFLSGESALIFIKKHLELIRPYLPASGICFICNSDNQINSILLPPNTWSVTNKISTKEFHGILNSISLLKDDIYESSRNWRVNSSIHIKNIRKCKPKFRTTCPNFNIKHPSILLPLALAAKEVNKPVCFEISPQEALIYYNANGKSCKEKVKNVLCQVRNDVDFVKQSLGSDIYLHLDHCDDPEIIIHAINIGFDSIMADGSKQGLNSNIKFVNNAVNYAEKFNVLVEGEVGAIDVHGRQKSSKTNLDEFKEFSDLTNADFIGINIGQIHGSDYGFDRARASHREIAGLSLKHNNLDLNSLYNACNEIQEEMKEFLINDRNNIINYIKNKIINNYQFNSFDELLSDFNALSLHDEYVLSKIISRWNKNRTDLSTTIINKYEEVLGIQLQSDHVSDEKRFLDIELLNDLNKNLKSSKAKLVLHGGSSIYTEELKIIKSLEIARINFGSEVFNIYMKTLLNHYDFNKKYKNYNNIFFIKNYLLTRSRNWREWLQSQPTWMNSFKNEIITKYFLPLN